MMIACRIWCYWMRKMYSTIAIFWLMRILRTRKKNRTNRKIMITLAILQFKRCRYRMILIIKMHYKMKKSKDRTKIDTRPLIIITAKVWVAIIIMEVTINIKSDHSVVTAITTIKEIITIRNIIRVIVI